ncbi:hypothetical protein ADIS_2630 [Lunatimonas lonarensis]|uniref:Steroid 5-alpha reductase C-terminal domain-containing protein n=1 Tax=Lunatimonas lonarensis TaxID=1232681 RepID=R7ZSA4_9BACT|nr:isoprenylcysteine carboxylmethyltransferase family protein [Lunatimonas lonarensis]EON76884.1 hypothetical protein ADIS_2630 [Lunatimonas lonarensis]
MALHTEFQQQGNWLFRRRSYLPIGLLAVGLLVYLRKVHHPTEFPLYESAFQAYYMYAAICVSMLGLIVRIFTVGFSPKNTPGRNTSEGQVADTLNTTGIYSLVRHPLYVGNFFMWFGPALMTTHLWFIIAFTCIYWIYYERIMYAEEQFLYGKFGVKFSNWAKEVPAFIPKMSGFESPNVSFSWKKVLKKEKMGSRHCFQLSFFLTCWGACIEALFRQILSWLPSSLGVPWHTSF